MLRAEKVAKKLFTVDEYYRITEAGILSEDDHVELIEGELVEMTAVGSRHAECVDRLSKLFSQRFAEDAIVLVQSPIRLSERTEPEPDLALLKPREDFYAGGHPAPDDVLLVVEVAETSVEYNSDVKLPLYARAGIPEAWLIGLAEATIEIHTRPTEDGYRNITRVKRGETLASETGRGLELAVGEILG